MKMNKKRKILALINMPLNKYITEKFSRDLTVEERNYLLSLDGITESSAIFIEQ